MSDNKMTAKTYITKSLEDAEERRLFQQEWSIESATDLVCERMEEQGVSRTRLAERMGVTKGWVTQLLNGNANMTIRTLSDVCFHLGRSLEFYDSPLEGVLGGLPAEFGVSSVESQVQSPNFAGGTESSDNWWKCEVPANACNA